MEHPAPFLVAFGNALWDICVVLPDDRVLFQFNLAEDGSKEVSAPEFESIEGAVKSLPKTGLPGGAALNTVRVFEWLLHKPNKPSDHTATVFFGSIGGDDLGKLLFKSVIEQGVDPRFKVRSNLHTGSVISLIRNNQRSLVAHIGAASTYNSEDLTEDNLNLITSVKFVYIENFFFSHSPDIVWDVVKLCKIHGVATILNFSGAYLIEEQAEDIASLVKRVNVVIGNESEFRAFAQAKEWGSIELGQILHDVCLGGTQTPPSISSPQAKPLKVENLERYGKVAIMTRGHMPVMSTAEDQEVFMTVVYPPDSPILDTTGAGDAFVAGFLRALMRPGLNLKSCIQYGNYAAGETLLQYGCRLDPNRIPMTIEEVLKKNLSMECQK